MKPNIKSVVAANCSEAMATGDHSKNGVRLKSQKSKIYTKSFVLLLLVLFSSLVYAQRDYQDVVYLKNGSIIRGVIIEQVPNKSIKIETRDRNVFVFQMDEIEKITKEYLRGRRDSTFDDTEDVVYNKGLQPGYKGIIEWGYQIGVGNFGIDRLKLNIINGGQLNPYFSLGFGTGLRYYYNISALLIPIFADFRINFINNTVSPYLSLGVGYSLDALHGEGAGAFFDPTVGVSFKISRKSAINVGVGYEMQWLKYYYSVEGYYGGYYDYHGGYYEEFTKISGALSLVLGISF